MTEWNEIQDALERRQRLDARRAVALFDPRRFHEAGRLANTERERRWGNAAFYNVNRHLNYSNVCALQCPLCAFHAREGDARGWALTLEQALDKARAEVPAGATELHIVGGAHPRLPFSYYEELLRGLKQVRPEIHLKAFSAVEIQFFSDQFAMPIREVLERLRAAGLDSLPGGGAEIFAERVRRRICPNKATAEQWLAVHRTAHGMGIRSNATILYGHVETPEERVDHLVRLRALQEETGGFQAIIPLKFHPENTALADVPRAGGVLDLQMIAACRLILDNFDHVKAYWPSLGLKIAQAALAWGADDLDGTVAQEQIYQTAGATAPQGLDVAALRGLIEEAGRKPVERDSLYRTAGCAGG